MSDIIIIIIMILVFRNERGNTLEMKEKVRMGEK